MNSSIALFKELFENFIVGLVILDEDNKIIHFNNSFQKMVKFNKKDLLNSKFTNYIYSNDQVKSKNHAAFMTYILFL